MKFGTNIITTKKSGESPAGVLKQFVANAVAAEALGFHSVWTTEHHFASDPDYRPFDLSLEEYPHFDYDLSPDPMTLLGWAAARTTKLHIGTAVSILHWDHPIRTVERAAMLDALCEGRLELGVGRGLGFREADVFCVPGEPKANERRYHEALSIIRRAWTGDYFQFDGEFYTVPRLAITPQPERQPCPAIVGSASMESAIWAAQNDLPYATITWPLVDFEHYREKRRRYLDAGHEAGFKVERHLCPHFLYMYCGESDREAADVAMKYMSQFQYVIEQHYELRRAHHQNQALMRSHRAEAHPARKGTESSAAGLEQVRVSSKQVVDVHIVGGIETCRERIRAFQKEANVNYIVLNMQFGGMPQELHAASMQRFAEHVMPHFAGAENTVAA